MTNNPNANLIEAMKEKLPLKGQLADMLMDTLYIVFLDIDQFRWNIKFFETLAINIFILVHPFE